MAQATIRDVAKRAQVSVASVSRVLNGLNNVGEATRERVTEAVASLGYVPHAAARSLSMARTHAIGVVLPDLHGEFFSEIVRGMDHVASARGYLLLLARLQDGGALGETALRALRGRVDGALVMAPHLSAKRLAEVLPPGVSVVLLNTRSAVEGHHTITLDNAGGAAAVAEHLLALGRRQILHVAGPRDNADARERQDAFAAALADRGVKLEVAQGDFTEASGAAAVAAMLEAGRSFDALFAANDNMAIGALVKLRQSGLRAPDDVAVAGFDDVPLARHLDLTTVRVRIAELGEEALAALIDSLEGRAPPAKRVHNVELVVRGTTTGMDRR